MKELTTEELLVRRYETIESIQSAIISAGGRFFTKKQIEGMKVEELFNIAIPNLVIIKAIYDTDTYIKLQN